jgi:hypothetical protein
MVKGATSSSGWTVVDNMRGMSVDGTTDPILYWNFSNSEDTSGRFTPQPTGFQVRSTSSYVNTSGQTYIFMAIRRGSLFPPDDATKVFNVSGSANSNVISTGFNVDMNINTTTNSQNNHIITRLMGNKSLKTNETESESDRSGVKWFNYLSNHINLNDSWWSTNSALISWSWKRAPSYFDVVAMTATSSSSSHTVNHNLTVPPEMVWIKRRDSTSSWTVYHNDGSTERTLYLETTLQGFSNSTLSSVGATSFVVNGGVLNASATYIMYLFASLDGLSKVGSYTGNSSDGKQIDCGFSNGARFVLLKNTTVSNTNWLLFDTVRGIVSGNDARLYLNSSDSEHSSTDYIDPYSSGFALTANAQVNYSGSTYIFYAIA